MIPFNDLNAHHNKNRAKFHDALDSLLDSSGFIGGKAVSEFETAFAKFCDANYCAGVANGTDAIFIALKALDIKSGDYVITTPNTFIATTEAITMTGASIIFVDVDPNERVIDLNLLAECLETHPEKDNIKCVIPVHLFGQPVEMKKLNEICSNKNIKIIADSAQAHGATIDGKGIAHYADMCTYSFYPGKNLGALGDGGAIVTNNEQYNAFAHKYLNHGRCEKYDHEFEGINSRLDALQALFLKIKLDELGEKTQLRQKFAKIYDKHLADLCSNINRPMIIENRLSVFHLYVIEVENRAEIQSKLKENNIQTGIHYPIPLHRLKAYEHLGLKAGSFPVTEKLSESILTLPLYPEMSEDDVVNVCNTLKSITKA
jgi:dTDP-4-amino-4,6-dideoxygalactose transaminase